MHPISFAAVGPDILTAKLHAGHHLHLAIDAVDAADAALAGIAAASNWESAGVRELQVVIGRLRVRCPVIGTGVRARADELSGVPLP